MQDSYTTPVAGRSALLSIDVQEDFTTPGAPAEVPGTHSCLPAMKRVLDVYRRRRLPIVHVVRLYRTDGTNADLCRRQSIERGAALVTPGSSGAELVEPLKPRPVRLDAELLFAGKLQELGGREWVLYKPRWDALHGTALEPHLRSLGVNTVVVMGCNFPNCPRATVYGATMRDFRVVFIADAVSGVYERGLDELRNIGVAVLTSDDCIRWIESPVA
ncbi:MAG: cysteine hydrolase [Acidobacteriia bacterium]|nr:cysteine hydrolase [Terriglobia bacterium]